MRITHFSSSLNLSSGGPIVALMGMATAQQAAGLEVTIAYSFRDADESTTAVETLRQAGVKTVGIGPGTGSLVRSPQMAEVKSLVQASEVVHVHGLWEEIQHQACTSARQQNVPYVITPHGMLDPWALKRKWLKKAIYRALRLNRDLYAAAAWHFAADRERELSMGRRTKPAAVVEPFGVDLAEFGSLPAAGAFRSRYPALGDRPFIAFLGRIFPEKGIEHLIAAMPHLQNREAALVLAGPDTVGFRAEIDRRIADLGIGDRVLFTGILRGVEKIAMLADAQVFGMPSEHENFGLVVAEAMAAGCPAIVSDEVNLCSTVRSAKAGDVVSLQPRDTLPQRLAGVIDQALEAGRQPDRRERIRRFALEAFDWQNIGCRWVKHYAAMR